MKNYLTHREHREIHINKNIHKVFQSAKSISPCSLWLLFDNTEVFRWLWTITL